ncbi:MAG: hypothetical protein WBC05_07675 [Sedimentisphaerales bacterium]
MSAAFKKFFKRFNPKGQDNPSEGIFVAAFGKHPGWDDHIDDIGFETDVFVTVKRILYIQGIGGNIDSGSWDKLKEDQLIEEFKHVFFWYINGNLVVGRMWSSQDGKGRKSYPFVACVQCSKLPIKWIFENVLPRLERVEATCAATTSANDVRMAIQSAGQELRQLAQQCAISPSPVIAYPDAVARLARHPEMGPNQEGLFRVLYHIEREVGRHRANSASTMALRSTSLRIPTSQDTMLESILLWNSFLFNMFGKNTPILILMPQRNNWTDIIIGDPTELQLYCLRASLKVIPLTSSIPYNMGSEFIDQANKLIKDALGG